MIQPVDYAGFIDHGCRALYGGLGIRVIHRRMDFRLWIRHLSVPTSGVHPAYGEERGRRGCTSCLDQPRRTRVRVCLRQTMNPRLRQSTHSNYSAFGKLTE